MQELNDGCSLGIDGNKPFGVLRLLFLTGSLESLQGELPERGDVWSWCLVIVSLYAYCTAGCGGSNRGLSILIRTIVS